MMESGNDRELTRTAIALRTTAVLAAILLTAGCMRSGPPAPVEDRSHASAFSRSGPSARPAEPTTTVAPAPRGSITSAPLDAPSAAPTSGPQPKALPPPLSQAAPSSAPAVRQAPAPPAAAEIEVKVASGQTLYAVARSYNVPVRALIELNNLDPPYALRTGQTIRVPNLPTHVVAEGETLSSVARQYNVGVRALAETNRIGPPYRIVPGSRLLIPRAEGATPAVATATLTPAPHVLQLPPGMVDSPAPTPAPPPAPATPTSSPDHVLRLPPGMVDAPTAEAVPASLPVTPPVPQKAAPGGRGFLWPVHGEILSPFGSKPGGTQNDGVNIVARRGTAVHAAADGVVVYAGNELRGYGNLLLIRHTDGWMSAYAHNDELLVGRGAHVKRGQVIAKVGGTGGVSSPQLHFELRHGGRPVDPMSVMGPMGPS